MKYFRIFCLVTLLSWWLTAGYAQHFNIHNPIVLPDKSQESIITQKIGYTDITVRYHSPAAKDRQVWGGLVPYGKVWRLGANENAVFTTTHELSIGGKSLPAGTYGLHLLPEQSEWTFIFSKNHTSWGSYFYDQAEDALRVTVPAANTPEPVEYMRFEFVKRDRGAGSLQLSWASQRATMAFSLDIDQIALTHIRQQLRSDAYWEWFSWCQAADYCAQYQINNKEALEWIDKSISMQENFSNYDVKAKLLKQAGDQNGAQQAMIRALEVGSPIYLERYGRRLMREKDFKQADEVFKKALKKDSNYWRAHYNRGKALTELGDKKNARKAYESALKHAPDTAKPYIKESIAAL